MAAKDAVDQIVERWGRYVVPQATGAIAVTAVRAKKLLVGVSLMTLPQR